MAFGIPCAVAAMALFLPRQLGLAITLGAAGIFGSLVVALEGNMLPLLRGAANYYHYAVTRPREARRSGLIATELQYPHQLFNLSTSWGRALPNLYIAGGMKAGTTTLHDWLCQHPAVVKGMIKETHYFDGRSAFVDWPFTRSTAVQRRVLASFFPTVLWTKFVAWRNGCESRVVDSTPAYEFYGPWIAPHIKRLTPNAKVIVVVRDPVERLKSHHKFGAQWGWDDLDIGEAIDQEPDRHPWEAKFQECIDAGHSGPLAGQDRFLWHSYVRRGQYKGIDAFISAFGKDQVLLLSLDELSEYPQKTMDRVFKFLDITPITISAVVTNAMTAYNPVKTGNAIKIPSSKLSEQAELALRQFYKESNAKLANLYGIEDAHKWNDKLTKLEIKMGFTQAKETAKAGA